MATETKVRPEESTAKDTNTTPPPPPSPSKSPPGQSAQPRRGSPPQADGKSYYGYLFNKDKTPTALLNALLRAIGKHIETEIGDKSRTQLDPSKIAAFYHAVGGNYDSLFVSAPHKSISYIWQALGVQHSLQPTENDFAEPSIPTLTLKGFVRWESLEILLGPEEHVPFIQFAVRNWALKHPDTGELFPVDLPVEAFPSVCDPQIDAWHRDCAKRLRNVSTQHAERHTQEHSQEPRVYYSHVRPTGPTREGPEMDYFSRERTVPRADASRRNAPDFHRRQPSPQKRGVNSSSGSNSPDTRSHRRKSFSDYPSPSYDPKHTNPHLAPRAPPQLRRHSQPRHHSPSSDSESDAPASPRTRAHRSSRPPVASVRVFPPESPAVTAATAQLPVRSSHRAEMRQDDSRRRSLPSGTFGFRQKLNSILPESLSRTRSTSHSDREHEGRPSARLRPEPHASRLSHRWSDDSYASEESDSDVSPKHRSRHDRERDRLRAEREQRERAREIEDERERQSRKDRAYLRPAMNRRTSSAAEVERRPRDWDSRDRYRGRDYDSIRDDRHVFTSDESGRRERRDRQREQDRGTSPVTGVGGRKYPTDNPKQAWT
ncbi:hypothetical protein BX600DRAFT_505913 [Xylariales sp. PMI_506]|nr:hypothetical protein BX600DRAFT_505913 [Xylariales sp. PMI_506]